MPSRSPAAWSEIVGGQQKRDYHKAPVFEAVLSARDSFREDTGSKLMEGK
jgi:hypothetical protein